MDDYAKAFSIISFEEDKIIRGLAKLRKSIFIKIIGSPITNPYQWDEVNLGDDIFFEFQRGEPLRKANFDPNGYYKVYGGNGIMGNHSKYLIEERKVIIGRVGANCGNVHVSYKNSWVTNNAYILHVDESNFILDYVAQMVRMLDLNKLATGIAQPHLSLRAIKNQTIFKPPLEVQKKLSSFLKKIRRLEVMFETRENLFQELKNHQNII